MIHPVITDAPSAVRNRSRNGPGGMGSRAKNPASSTGEVVMPALVCVSSVPGCGGTTWPSREPPVTSSSMDRWGEVKVRARIVAVSDLAGRHRVRVGPRVVGQLRELGVDVVPGVGVLAHLDEPRGHGGPGFHHLA